MLKRLLSLLVCLCLMASCALAENHQAWINGELTQQAGKGSEWYILALCHSGEYDFASYRTALQSRMAQGGTVSAATRQKYALTLLATGSPPGDFSVLLEETLGRQGIMSWIFGLHLMNNGCTAPGHTIEEVLSQLLSMQLEDGGWAVTGTISDADVTAMALQALSPHGTKPDVASAVEKALTLLSSRQLDSGDFASYGVPSAESTAQVMIALFCLGIDCTSDQRFIKQGCTLMDGLALYRLEDGGYSHTRGGAENALATSQAFLALTALEHQQQGSIFLFPPVKQSPSWQTIAMGAVAGLTLLGCLLLLVLHKRSWKNFATLALAACLLIFGISQLDIQSAESYYTPPAVTAGEPIGSVTLTIRCDTVAGLAEHLPEDGVILPAVSLPIQQESTVLDALTLAARTHGLRMDVSGGYVAGIQSLFEFDFGQLSGWMYQVNGETASVGCDQYILQDGDVITWQYTCSLGSDLQP